MDNLFIWKVCGQEKDCDEEYLGWHDFILVGKTPEEVVKRVEDTGHKNVMWFSKTPIDSIVEIIIE